MIEEINEWFAENVPEPKPGDKWALLGAHYLRTASVLVVSRDEDEARAVARIGAVYGLGNNVGFPQEMRDAINTIDKEKLARAIAMQICSAVGVCHAFGIDISAELRAAHDKNVVDTGKRPTAH